MMARILAFAIAGSMPAEARNDENLAIIRGLAMKMSQARSYGTDSAHCEYVTVSQVDGCSGPNRNAFRHRISRKGLIESWDYRSPGQNGEPIGYYRGRIDEKEWRTLLRMVAAMRWTEDPVGMGGPRHPPGPTESISVLSLSDGKVKAGYGTTGPTPGPISDAMDQPSLLARGPMDTVWQLSLINPKAEIRKDSVHVTAEWKWRGPPGSRILFSQEAGGEFCGTARFRWFLDTAAYSVEWHEATATPGKGRGLSWDLSGPKPGMLRLAFPYKGPKGKAKRVAVLDGIGIRLIAGGSQDTVSATVFTERFDF